ncbi:hypothetical protein AYX15_07133 [Cryptococcus neoformans]|nr:hypothetical protein AYX15_07133 [Cryptococcus neoformans var. grubii]
MQRKTGANRKGTHKAIIEIPPLAVRTVAAEYYPELPMTAIHSIIQDLENAAMSSVGLVGYQ